ncbi:MAG: amidohydrolase family protein [Candidatus Ozemobacteraceae bacterium]
MILLPACRVAAIVVPETDICCPVLRDEEIKQPCFHLENVHWIDNDGDICTGSLSSDNGMLRLEIRDKGSKNRSDLKALSDGSLILPGMIDPHTHFREPGQESKEGIKIGSKAALAGGVTTVLDMPNNKPPIETPEAFENKKALFKKECDVSWGLHIQAGKTFFGPWPNGIASVKVYLSKASEKPGITDVDDLVGIFTSAERVTIHAEDETQFCTGKLHHHESRPLAAVESALKKISEAYEKVPAEKKPTLIFCHVATRVELDWLWNAKAAGWKVYAETCPHYLYWTCEDQMRIGSGLQVNPPLREEKDRKALIEAISDGTIDFIGSDHAPHLPFEKADTTHPPSGIASIELMMPLMLNLVDAGIISWKRFIDLCCANASRIYNVEGRDGIKEGNYADLVQISARGAFRAPWPPITRACYHPYRETTFSRRVERVFTAGNPA